MLRADRHQRLLFYDDCVLRNDMAYLALSTMILNDIAESQIKDSEYLSSSMMKWNYAME